jgi:hypothetical protein
MSRKEFAMPETPLRCPECDARISAAASPGRSSVRCPKCGASVPLKAKRPVADDEDEDERPRRAAKRRDEDERPARSSRRRQDDDDEDEDDEDRPRSRRRRWDDEDEDDADDRPRRRKKGRKIEGDGPWYIAAAIAGVGFFLTFAGALLIKGKAGLDPGQDGPGGKLIGLGVCFIVALVLIPLGIMGVKNRTAYGRWGIEVTGTMGVILGMIQATAGGLLGGFALYGVIFTLVNGR